MPLRQFLHITGCLAIVAACISCTKDSGTEPQNTPPAVVGSDSGHTAPIGETDPSEMEIDRTGQVLRHAVFFSFKEESSEEDIAGVAAAFAALPSKIEEIIDFQWGVNNSPEGKDDGFTHCFLLTFENAAGRDVYLPHDEHKAFGDVLRPHMADVFVIDYWGTPSETPLESELKHAVFFKFKDDAAAADIAAVEEAFAALPSKIDAIKAFEWGTNNSPEKHSDDFTHCFMVTFADDDGRQEYLPHPDHMEFVDVLKPVLDKVRVLDFTPEK